MQQDRPVSVVGRCALCNCGLDGVEFLQVEATVNCLACYTQYKAARCVACNSAIVSTDSTQARVTYQVVKRLSILFLDSY